jgi:hypothetical protein
MVKTTALQKPHPVKDRAFCYSTTSGSGSGASTTGVGRFLLLWLEHGCGHWILECDLETYLSALRDWMVAKAEVTVAEFRVRVLEQPAEDGRGDDQEEIGKF